MESNLGRNLNYADVYNRSKGTHAQICEIESIEAGIEETILIGRRHTPIWSFGTTPEKIGRLDIVLIERAGRNRGR